MPANAAFPSVNTGPKGVLNDYRIAKERMEKRMKEQREHDHAFVEKSTMTASTVSQDEKSKLAAKIDQMDEDELDALGMKQSCSFRPTMLPYQILLALMQLTDHFTMCFSE